MEQTNLQNPPLLVETVQWQWQSDLTPYKESNSEKWNWQDYSDDDNLIIEEAYLQNQETVGLKDYDIDIKNRLQINKQDKNKVRRIRRQEPSRFMMEMPEAKAIVKDQKTMNEAFGTVQHFLEFLMKRTPQAFTLYQSLGKLSLDCNRAEFEGLVTEVKACLEKGAEVRAKVIKTRTARKPTDYILEAKKVKDEIENNSSTLRDFLRTILKSYTMETFICYWLNELLRSENWEVINVLTPYLVCLVHTFQLPDYVLQSQSSQINKRLGFDLKHKLYLFRGAALTEEQLMKYNPKRIKYFSWNGITSTSRSRDVAHKFMSLSLLDYPEKIGVLFFIEIDLDLLEDYHGIIDVAKDSKFPKEQEVILVPGTVFKLLEISLIENDIYEIRLKVTKNIKEAQEEVSLLGILQDQAIKKDQAFIDGLHTQQGLKILEFLKGNKLIRKLEITNSGIAEKLMKEIENMRGTTNVQKGDIKLVGNTIDVSSLSVLVDHFSAGNLSDIFSKNKIRFGSDVGQKHEIEKGSQLESLILKDETIEMFRKNGQPNAIWQGLQNEIQIGEITLSLHKTQAIKNELKNLLGNLSLKLNERQKTLIENLDDLCQAIGLSVTLNHLSLKLPFTKNGLNILQEILFPLEHLESLDLDFSGSNKTLEEESNSLWSRLKSLTSLKHLSLNFWKCDLSDKGLGHLKDAIISLPSLKHLYLGFKSCGQISDEGLISLKIAFASRTTLEHLSCDIFACSQISSEGLKNLMHESSFGECLEHISIDIRFCRQISGKKLNYLESALISLNSPRSFSLDLEFWKQVSDQEMDHLKFLKSCQFFHSLTFNFQECNRISSEGINHLKDILRIFHSLQNLSLDFDYCKIEDEGLSHLRDALLSLKSLQSLCLQFKYCHKISDRGLYYLWNALKELKSLKRLSLGVSQCDQVSDYRLNDLQSIIGEFKSLQHLSLDFNCPEKNAEDGLDLLLSVLASLPTLQHLSLRFGAGIKISDEGLNYLKSALVSLAYLENLSLEFYNCKFSDEGLNHLKNGLKPLKVLKYLYLSIVNCEYSNEGSNLLVSALASLTTLERLDLRFWGLTPVLDKELDHLKSALVPLKSLQNLSLNFWGDTQISDKGLENLKCVFTSLTSLQHLSVHFDACNQISDEGLGHLRIGLISLLSLQYLSIGFNDCLKISDQGLSSIKNAITGLSSLQNLSIGFGYSGFTWNFCEGSRQISDQGFSCLHNAIVSLPSLQTLSLSFRKCKISEKSLDQLKRTIASLTSLKHLNLTIWASDVISDTWLNHLKTAFARLTSLEDLSLSFMGSYQISDQGLAYLQNALMPLLSLQDLSVDFSSCNRISKKGLNYLKNALTSLPSLQNVSLDFYSCDQVSKKRLKRFKTKLQVIPSLTIEQRS